MLQLIGSHNSRLVGFNTEDGSSPWLHFHRLHSCLLLHHHGGLLLTEVHLGKDIAEPHQQSSTLKIYLHTNNGHYLVGDWRILDVVWCDRQLSLLDWSCR